MHTAGMVEAFRLPQDRTSRGTVHVQIGPYQRDFTASDASPPLVAVEQHLQLWIWPLLNASQIALKGVKTVGDGNTDIAMYLISTSRYQPPSLHIYSSSCACC
jgi:hypothetical protein